MAHICNDYYKSSYTVCLECEHEGYIASREGESDV